MKSALINNSLGSDLPVIDKAEGVWLFDSTGKKYLDGCSGAVVVSVGHGHPHVLRAIQEQASRVTFTHRGAFTSQATEGLAQRLSGLTGYPGVWLVNSGSEAVEAAMQFALQYFRERGQPEKSWFLSAANGYHGNTLGALSLSGHGRRATVENLAHHFATLPTPYAYQDGLGVTESEYAETLIAETRREMERNSHHLAGLILEPVGGATLGATVPPDGYWQGLRSLCDEFGVLLIADEVMTGLGRTGRLLATEHWGVRPDLVALGKSLGAGYTPIAANLVSAEILEVIQGGTGRILGGHTYAGNPLSAAVASAVLDVLENECLVGRAETQGSYLRAGLARLAERHPMVGEVRGLGLQQAIEFVNEADERRAALPQGRIAQAVAAATVSRGLVLYPATGGFNDAVLVAPPLTVSVAEIDLLVEILDDALTEVGRLIEAQMVVTP